MTITTFYASTPLSGISLGGSTNINNNVILALHNPSNSTTQVSIQNLYWTFISGTMGFCNLIWVQNKQITKLIGGTKLTATAIGNSTTSKSEINSGNLILEESPKLIRPSIISFNGPAIETVESFNFNEFTVLPGQVIAIESIGNVGTADKSIITLVWQENTAQ